MKRISRLLLGLVLAAASSAHAQRFRGAPVDEPFLLDLQTFNTSLGVGARALGMGGAFIALADDATAASWNPAGLAFLTRPEFSVVLDTTTSDLDTTRYVDTEPFGLEFQQRRDPSRDKGKARGISFLSAAYPFRFEGRRATLQVSYHREVRPLDSDSFVTENYAYRPYEAPTDTLERHTKLSSTGGFDTLSIGLGTTVSSKLYAGVTLNGWFGSPESTRLTEIQGHPTGDPGATEGYPRAAAIETRRLNVTGFSVNAGVLYRPFAWLSVGAVYRSAWVGRVRSTVTFVQQGVDYYTPDGAKDAVYAPIAYAGSAEASGTISWPAAYGVGLAVRPVPRLVFSVDFTRQEWSRGRAELPFISWTCVNGPTNRTCLGTGTYLAPVLLPAQLLTPQPGPDGGTRSQSDLDVFAQRDQDSLRLGAELVFFLGSFVVPVRAGFYRVDSIAPYFESAITYGSGHFVADPGHQVLTGYTAGLSVGYGGLSLDVAYVHDTSSDDRESLEPPGPDTGHRELANTRILAGLTYRF